MPFDPLPSATHNPTSGTVVPVTWLDLINSNFEAIGAAWTAFTPEWTATTTNPAIGNGTMSGGYLQLGKTLHVRYWIKPGSTTTYGTGVWELLLPNSLSVSSAYTQIIGASCYDTSSGTWYSGDAYIGSVGSTTKLSVRTDQQTSSVSVNVPFAWAAGDELMAQGTLQVA